MLTTYLLWQDVEPSESMLRLIERVDTIESSAPIIRAIPPDVDSPEETRS